MIFIAFAFLGGFLAVGIVVVKSLLADTPQDGGTASAE